MEQLNAKDLQSSLWAAADEMRAKMTADVYKDYLLGLIFYKVYQIRPYIKLSIF